MKNKTIQVEELKMNFFKSLVLSGLCGAASLAGAANGNLEDYKSNSIRVCACRCDSFVAQLCPKQLDGRGECDDLDFEFGSLANDACKNLTGTACKGYSARYSGALRGKSAECELVAREQK